MGNFNETMIIIKPRLNDFYGIPFTQEEVDFAIPFLDEDIPLYIDPFLFWKSPSQQDNGLHLSVINSFNYLGNQYFKGNSDCVQTLIRISECNEVGLGSSKTKIGKRIGEKLATEIFHYTKIFHKSLNLALLIFKRFNFTFTILQKIKL